jgi:hypothetical protein
LYIVFEVLGSNPLEWVSRGFCFFWHKALAFYPDIERKKERQRKPLDSGDMSPWLLLSTIATKYRLKCIYQGL